MTVRNEKVIYKTNDVIMITFLLNAKQKKTLMTGNIFP